MVTVLGLHDGHTATAAIIRDGIILAVISEERLTRIKNHGGFPLNAINEVLRITGILPEEIDFVSVAGLCKSVLPEEMMDESKLFRRIFSNLTGLIPSKIIGSKKLIGPYKQFYKRFKNHEKISKQLKNLKINAEIKYVEHHLAHAATAAYTSTFKDEESLIITCDGSGDGICSTINICKDNEITRLDETASFHSIGEFYSRITQFLGMKPLEHEYKVMGLAPYVPPTYANKAYNSVFQDMFKVENTRFINNTGRWGRSYLKYFNQKFKGLRFDTIASGTQQLVEKNILKWIQNVIKETGISNVSLAGGVFMNVKLNMLLHNMDEIEKLFIFPSCGDESIAIGAALSTYVDFCYENGKKIDVESLGPIYLGGKFSNEYISNYLDSEIKNKVDVIYIENIEQEIAELISKNKIVARVNGRMEWGARALGNRSILANPSDNRVINKINKSIKMRDFWMPFTPSILFERKDDYLLDPQKTKSPYMIMAYNTTKLAQKDIIAALHPYDLTARPQILEKSWNHEYYSIINEFNNITGLGAVLNTSFNLHGDPVVYTPEDAIHTLINSSLDYLALGNYLVERSRS